MHKSLSLAMAALMFSLPTAAFAQLDYNQEDAKRVRAAEVVGTLGTDLFGEQTNFYTGSTSFRHGDLSIPGNNGLAMDVSRSVDISDPDVKHNPLGRTFGDWELELPYIGGVFLEALGWAVDTATPQLRCSSPTNVITLGPKGHNGFQPQRYWQGYDVVIPGRGSQSLLLKFANDPHTPTTGGPWRWTTKDLTQISCLSSLSLNGGAGAGYTGEGFLAVTPDGYRYWFDQMVVSAALPIRQRISTSAGSYLVTEQRKEIRLYASRIEDPFGNAVTFHRSAGRLTTINASDGRSLSFTYDAASRIRTATDGVRTITYNYLPSGHLGSVVRPDGSAWSFQLTNVAPQHYTAANPDPYYGTWDPSSPECGWKRVLADDERVGTITHPSGATGSFTFRYQRHVRASVPDSHCSYDTLVPPGGGLGSSNGSPEMQDWKYQSWTPRTFDVIALKRKQITGPGVSAMNWDYAYTVPGIGHMDYGPHTRFVTITEPDGSQLKQTFGNRYMINDGQLLAEEVIQGGQVLQRRDMTYVTNPAGYPFPDRVGIDSRWNGDVLTSERNRPQISTVTTRQGVTFTGLTEVFDTKARPVTTRRFSSLPSSQTRPQSRRDTTTYHDVPAKWILGQVAQTLNVDLNLILSKTEFDSTTGAPLRFYGAGEPGPSPAAPPKLLQTVTWRADGTVATLKDGRNLTTQLNDWYRGIPRSIVFADATTRTATVNTIGQVTSTTDQNGFTTQYAYDAGGRLSQRTWPTGDTVAWTPTVITYAQVGAAEYGIPAGHWRQIITTGNARTETYFDALMRPRLVREYDTAAPVATSRFTVKDFDHGGRETFSAYPLASLSSITGATQGVWSTYDALGRVIAVSQDSEQGLLTTASQYLTGFQTRTTNPRGHQTTISYQAFDQPDPSSPVLIQAPASVATDIARTVLGEPTRITRSGTWSGGTQSLARQYFYDAHRRLCKSLEPETGTTLLGYDAAQNLSWSAAGLPAAQACEEAGTSPAVVARKAARQYDSLNRLTSLTFPDSNGNQTWTYTPDGLPDSITTLNNDGATSVVNTYSYNKRRLMTAETASIPGWYTWTLGYGYTASGHLASQTYPTGLNVAYAPNALGQPTQAGSFATGVKYHPNGAIKEFTYGNGLVHTMVQNARQLPARSLDTGGALDHEYGYDANGNVLATIDHNESARSRWMTYDALDRLTSAGSVVFGGDHWHRFTYDALDNIRSWKLAGVKDFADYAYDPTTNRLDAIKNSGGSTLHSFAYNSQGNLTNKSGAGYHFDYGNRLRSATSPAGTEGYRYDGHGRRVLAWTTAGSKLTMYSSNGQVMYQHSDPQQKTIENIYLGGSLVASREKPFTSAHVVKYQHTDALGSPVAVTDQTGAVIDRTNYDPYGGAINKTVDAIGYTGHVMDPVTGLTYMQQRYYDPAIGRFLSVDPVTALSSPVGQFNRYRYADNNPYKFVDPDGRLAMRKHKTFCEAVRVCQTGSMHGPSRSDRDKEGSSAGGGRRLEATQERGNEGIDGSRSLTRFWKLSAPSDVGGHIVQEVTSVGTVTYTHGSSISQTITHWEAWSVEAGASSPTPIGTDTFKISRIGEGIISVRVEVTATARFYEGLVNLPDSFRVRTETSSGMLPMSYVNPHLGTEGATEPVVIRYLLIWP